PIAVQTWRSRFRGSVEGARPSAGGKHGMELAACDRHVLVHDLELVASQLHVEAPGERAPKTLAKRERAGVVGLHCAPKPATRRAKEGAAEPSGDSRHGSEAQNASRVISIQSSSPSGGGLLRHSPVTR